MRKLIITINILSFLNLVGCYYQEQMNPSKYNFDEEEKLQLTTKDTTYNIGKKDYYLENDTLFVTFRKTLDRQSTIKTVSEIPIRDIDSVKVEKFDGLKTLLGVGGITLLAMIIVVSIFDSGISLGKK